jgi:DinB superfamily
MKKKIMLLLLIALSSCSTKKNTAIIAESSNTALTQKEREFLINTLNASSDKFENAIRSLSEAQLNFKVKDKKWAIAECIEHVTLAELRFPEIVKEEMTKPSNPEYRSKIRIKDEKIRPKMLSRIWKARSPEVFKPTGKFTNPQEAIDTFRKQRLRTISYIETTNDDLRNHFWKHPLTGTIDLYQTLILMSAHLERHVEQMENNKKAACYPNI